MHLNASILSSCVCGQRTKPNITSSFEKALKQLTLRFTLVVCY